MVNLFIKITQEERLALKRIVRALGFSTMTKWLKAWIEDRLEEEDNIKKTKIWQDETMEVMEENIKRIEEKAFLARDKIKLEEVIEEVKNEMKNKEKYLTK